MRQISLQNGWVRFNEWRQQRQVQNALTLSLVCLGPVLVFFTYLGMRQLNSGISTEELRIILLIDFVYVLVVATLISRRIIQTVGARRAKSAGSQLHLRLSAVFALVAFVPTVLVAVVATLTLNVGLEGWFSDRVRNAVGTSLSAAEAYQNEQRDDLIVDTGRLADFLNQQRRQRAFMTEAELRQILTQGQSGIQRGLKEAFLIDGGGALRSRGERSYLFDFEKPSVEEIESSAAGEIIVIQDWDNNEFRGLTKLASYPDRYLYVSRIVDGSLLNLLDDTKETVGFYNQMESQRGRLLFDFGLIYLGFAVIVILAATWLGLWFAERLARPVGRLAGAAARVGRGDLDVQVREEKGDDEIAMLGRVFNRMTKQVKGQRDDLILANERTERRRRLFDSVLSSVTAGVIGLNSESKIELMNAAATDLLNLSVEKDIGKDISLAVPEFSPLFQQLNDRPANVRQEEIGLTRAGGTENLLVRMAMRLTETGDLEGYVITFDDVTNLVSAQRMAAWGDVARRIAHEIKNPLTPIQLSAERLRRKFAPMVGDQAETLEQYSDIIIRQTGDLRRIVDEFSKFARMPEPERRTHDLSSLISDAVVLQQSAYQEIKISLDNPLGRITGDIDSTMISQALTNLIKNAAEAIEAGQEKNEHQDTNPEIRVIVSRTDETVEILIQDNGIGLPEQRSRLFEPYVTYRDKGTGLGLPIVKKIIEEHGGTLELSDAPVFSGNSHAGAMATIILPLAYQDKTEIESVNLA